MKPNRPGCYSCLLGRRSDQHQRRRVARSADISGRMARLGYGAEAIALLGIARLHGVGFQTLTRLGGRDAIRRLLDQRDLGVFEQAISAAGGRVPAKSPASGWDGVRRLIWSQGVEQARTLAERGASFIFDDDPKFPRSLSELPPASRPRWLYYRGNIGLLERPCLTVVGTRDPSPSGEFLARYAVSCAREFDAPVISGLARGVDRVAHEWCLQIGLPTISVMATGILTLYPARHADLGDQIVQAGGLLVSEYLPDQDQPRRTSSGEIACRRHLAGPSSPLSGRGSPAPHIPSVSPGILAARSLASGFLMSGSRPTQEWATTTSACRANTLDSSISFDRSWWCPPTGGASRASSSCSEMGSNAPEACPTVT